MSFIEGKGVCSLHNLPNSYVCLSETCRNRIGCEACIKKHKHKYFLDEAVHYKPADQIFNDNSSKLK